MLSASEVLKQSRIVFVDPYPFKRALKVLGHMVYPPAYIVENDISTVLVDSIVYREEIAGIIKHSYPMVKRILYPSFKKENGKFCFYLKDIYSGELI